MSDLKWAIAREIPHLRRYARALVGDVAGADDLVQDALERALKKRHLWTRRGSLRAWLFQVLLNVHLNGHRGRLRERMTVPMADAEWPGALPANQDQRLECAHVVEALGRLPPDQREALLLITLEGMAYDEAAWVLNIPIGTLRSRLSRARETLRQSLQGSPRGSPRESSPRAGLLRRVK